jgi:hypothetical protein
VFIGLGLLALAPLIAHAQAADTVVIAWTAPGDDGNAGTASGYDVRYSESPIDAGTFDGAARIEDVPSPAHAGTRQHFTVRGLTRGTTYYFAMRSVDDAGNWSGISNLVRFDWTVDTAPPAAPHGATGGKEGNSVSIAWSPSPEADLDGYYVYRAAQAEGPYARITPDPITATEYVDSDPPSNAATVSYQVTAVDVHGNESARSAPITVTLDPSALAATEWSIEPGFPNPSRASQTVQITVVVPASGGGTLVVDIVDAAGRLVRRLEAAAAPGVQQVSWDGKNDSGREVAPGPYRAWLLSGGSKKSIRLVRVP